MSRRSFWPDDAPYHRWQCPEASYDPRWFPPAQVQRPSYHAPSRYHNSSRSFYDSDAYERTPPSLYAGGHSRPPFAGLQRATSSSTPSHRPYDQRERTSHRPRSEPPQHFKHSLPKDWIDLTPIGKVIEKSPFICFKTPFNRLSSYPRRHRSKPFSTKRLLLDLEERNIKLGLVIDLTDTNRYYEPDRLKDAGVIVVKMRVPGKGVPSMGAYEKFRSEVENFLGSDPGEKLIGVHCTHGINRTGWFVCRYLMETTGISAEDVIRIFGEARGHTMYREYILEDLRKFDKERNTKRLTAEAIATEEGKPTEETLPDGNSKRLTLSSTLE